jgi:hypothetical protein
MNNEEEWSDSEESSENSEQMRAEFERMVGLLHKKHLHALNYLVAEGFLEKVNDHEYNYTPEGYVIAMEQMKQMFGGASEG